MLCYTISVMKNVILHSIKETEDFGISLANTLLPGAIIALQGDLGAGKTTLTKAIAKGLGITETLTSPTFTIVCEYDSGRLPLYHFDVYRVYDTEDLFEIGFEDYFHKNGVCIIEWANLLEEGLLPKDAITIELSYGSSDDERILTIS